MSKKFANEIIDNLADGTSRFTASISNSVLFRDN